MAIVLAIVSVILLLSLAFNLILWKVLKNTFHTLIEAETMLKSDFCEGIAYDDNYYYCKLLMMTIEFEQPHTQMIADFSLYDEKQVIGLSIKTKHTMKHYFSKMPEAYITQKEAFGDKEAHVMIPSAVVYAPAEGVWTWKPMIRRKDEDG